MAAVGRLRETARHLTEKVEINLVMPIAFRRSANCLAPLVSFVALLLSATPAFSQFVPGSEYYNQPALATINVLPAYQAGLSGRNVLIGIVDTGINPQHVEFRDAIVAGYNGITGISGTRDFSSFLWDDHAMPHGSHVASIAAGRLDGADRPLNVQGVAYDAKLLIASWDNYATDEAFNAQTSQGLRFASSRGARVINNSWAIPDLSPLNVRAENFLSSSPGLISALMDTLDQGSVIVFASGNSSLDDPLAPALLPSYLPELAAKGGWIVVASTTIDGSALSYFTNKCGVSKYYCIAAPGGNQYFENDPQGILGANGNTNDGYVYWQGTSMASPVVSGAVALVAEQFPWMTNKNLATTILTTASRAENPDVEWGRGLLNVGKAIQGPGIFEEDFSADVTAGYASTFSNNISGTAGLIKLGAGSLALTGVNSYTGNTYLNGGTLIAYQQANLGNTASALRFAGGTLKFGADFTLSRDLWLAAQGGTLDLNGYDHTQSSQIGGSGRFGVTGGGSLTLDRANTQLGGLAVRGGSQVYAQRDDYLGATGSSVLLDHGRLNLLNGFVAATPGEFTRPLEIGSGHGTIDTGNNSLVYTGGTISGGGMLSFIGTPFTLGSDLTLNGVWNSNLEVPASLVLKGNGGVGGDLLVLGTLAPGNSPGVLTVSGSVINAAGSTFNVEIDGPATGVGAGSYDRLVLTGAGSTYTAGGTLNLLLRGITGAANNTYQPGLGQGFQFVTAPGGILGSYASVNQPGAGLLPGTRMDLVWGSTSLAAYVTPASYAELDAVGVSNNRNRQQIGSILQSIRPAAGLQAADAEAQAIFAGLAAQTTETLPPSLDQLAGVGYVQLLAVNSENTRYMTEQTLMVAGRQRRNETVSGMPGMSGKAPNGTDEQIWGMALGRSSRWGADRNGYGISDGLSGLMGGAFKHIDGDTLAGFSLAYGSSAPDIHQNIGGGQMQNLQLMGYASHKMAGGFFLQGGAGIGTGNIEAKRKVAILGNQYDANIVTTNASLAAQGGWASAPSDAVHYEALFGLNYLVQRSSSFKDSTRRNMAELHADAATKQALVVTASGSANAPFQANGIDWNLSARAGLSHDLFNPRSELDAKLMGQSYQLESSAIGRTRLQLGLGVSGRIAEHTQLGFDLGYQVAQNWASIGASIAVQVRF